MSLTYADRSLFVLKKTKNDVPRMNSVGINKLKNNIQYKIKLLKCLSFSHKFRT